MFNLLIYSGQTWENVDLGNTSLPPPLLLQENLRFRNNYICIVSVFHTIILFK